MAARIHMRDFQKILSQNMTFKKYLLYRIMHYYTDESKVFLLNSLRQIEYLANISAEVILNISFWMTMHLVEPGKYLIKAGEDSKELSECGLEMMFIIY